MVSRFRPGNGTDVDGEAILAHNFEIMQAEWVTVLPLDAVGPFSQYPDTHVIEDGEYV